MTALVVGLALLLGSAACGGGSSRAERAERAALLVEIRDSHAATLAAHETVAARAAERSAAQVAALEARAARGEPLFIDVDTLRNNTAAAAVAWETQIADGHNESGQRLNTARGCDCGRGVGFAVPVRDGRGPHATGHRGVGPRCGERGPRTGGRYGGTRGGGSAVRRTP